MGGSLFTQILCLCLQSNKLSAHSALPAVEFNKSLLRSSYFFAAVNLLINTGNLKAEFYRGAFLIFAPPIIPALQIRYWQAEQEDANALRTGANNEKLKCTLFTAC
jgi:hypothetical protein